MSVRHSLLDRGYAADLAQDQYLAGFMSWALGEVPVVLVLLAGFAQCYRDDSRLARRHDQRAERDGELDLES